MDSIWFPIIAAGFYCSVVVIFAFVNALWYSNRDKE